VDATIWAAILGGAVTGVIAGVSTTWAVIASNKNARKEAAEDRSQARHDAHEEKLSRYRAELAGPNRALRKLATADLRALAARMDGPDFTDSDREEVLRMLNSELAQPADVIEQYPGDALPEVQVIEESDEEPE